MIYRSREHKIAWVVTCVLGAVIGLFYGYASSPFTESGAHFLAYLQNPILYWHWLLFGTVIAGLAFYAWELIRLGKSN
jgi:H+/Cl- antiporter ClcA